MLRKLWYIVHSYIPLNRDKQSALGHQGSLDCIVIYRLITLLVSDECNREAATGGAAQNVRCEYRVRVIICTSAQFAYSHYNHPHLE